jgi:hypothetical protein
MSSCIKDTLDDLKGIKGVELHPHVSAPLIKDHMGIKALYNSYSEKAFIIEGPDKFITFIYQSRDSLAPKQFVTVPSVTFGYDVKVDEGAIAQFNAIGQYSNSFSNYAVITTSNKERMKKVSIKDGRFNLTITSTFKHNATIVFVYPSITRNGKPLIDTVKLLYNNAPISIPKELSLDGYDVDLSDGGISYNVVPYLFQVDLTRIPGNDITVNDFLNITEEIHIDEYNFVQGYLGKFSVLNYSTDEALDLFDKQADGNVFIKDPKFKVGLENGVGIPITVKVSNMRILTGNGSIYPINIEKFKDTFSFEYPNINQQGQIIKSSYTIDRTNSNIDTVLSRSPQRVQYDVDFTANYSEAEDVDNFLYDNNDFKAETSIELPLELTIANYTLKNSGAVKWEDQPDNVQIDWVKIVGRYENSFPIGIKVQLYFTKDSVINAVDSFVVVDSLYAQPVPVTGAIIDADGKIIQPSVIMQETIIDAEKYERLKKSNKYLLAAWIRTSEFNGSQPFVKIYSYQGLDFRVGVEAKGKYRQKF